MQTIDESRLESDIQYRYEFLCQFMDFGADDVKLIQAAAPHLGPRVPQIVEQTYVKLLSFDCTARHFVPRQHGFDGPTPPNLADLSIDHPQIRFRKDHLNRYFIQLIGRTYDAKMVQYFDMVGKIHTPLAGNKAINVPLVQMNALMGVIAAVLFQSISEWTIPSTVQFKTLQAFSKLLWIQNDFINRHYTGT